MQKKEDDKVPCQYFMLGTCKHSSDSLCQFSHDPKLCKPGFYNIQCLFYQQGHCRNGNHCLYLHDGSDVNWNKPKQVSKPLKIAKKPVKLEKENFTFSEKVIHEQNEPPLEEFNGFVGEIDDFFTYSDAKAFTSTQPEQPTRQQSWSNFAETQRKNQEILDNLFNFGDTEVEPVTKELEKIKLKPESTETECCICLEIIENKKDPRFGLLRNCDHAFCVTCIRDWRTQDVTDTQQELELARSCPVCRTVSYFIVPSLVFVVGEAKEKLVEEYLTKLKGTKCRFFKSNEGVQSCPFGVNCFYGHFDEFGNQVWKEDNQLRLLQTVEGDKIDTKNTLYEFINKK